VLDNWRERDRERDRERECVCVCVYCIRMIDLVLFYMFCELTEVLDNIILRLRHKQHKHQSIFNNLDLLQELCREVLLLHKSQLQYVSPEKECTFLRIG
jgi:hypothetical protein